MFQRFLLILILAPALSLKGQTVRLYMKAAQQFVDNGFYEEAIDQYNKALVLDPKNGSAYEARGKANELLKNFESAAGDYEKAAVFMENPAENYYKAAQIFQKLSENQKSLDDIKRAIEQRSKFYDAYVLQCEVLMTLKKYEDAKTAAENALNTKNTAYAMYLLGLSQYNLEDYTEAEQNLEKAIIKDKLLLSSYLYLAKLQLKTGKKQYAIDNCSYVIKNDRNNKDAYFIRSEAYNDNGEYQKAIDDASKAISLDTSNVNYYIQRGKYYVKLAQYQNAINDYTLALNIDALNVDALESRAEAYESINEKEKAASDYSLLLTMANQSDKISADKIKTKIFNLQRESDKPVINLLNPKLTSKFEVPIPNNKQSIILKGSLTDQSLIKLLRVNNDTLVDNPKSFANKDFSVNLSTTDLDFVTISATDIYDNTATVSYAVEHIETNKPKVSLVNPYVGDDGIIPISGDDNYLYLEGRVQDESLISSIKIDNVNASYAPSDIDPRFTATLDISKKTKINVEVTDIYGNTTKKEYLFRRDNRMLSDDSPMGKTWVVLIENSMYKGFTNLSSPESDLKNMQQALANYKINKIIVKKNLTKRELERFFSIDLRDLVRVNNVNSLMIWYAGHGVYLNKTGYWIPSDATEDDEFSYYNINALKASLYSYTSLTHLLVISDACQTGPAFAVAMRGPTEGISCLDPKYLTQKSAQVLTSSGSGYAYDNSFFTRSFVNTLLNNVNDCLTIDDIVKKVNIIMQTNSSQVPEFGRINGFDDQKGTFFFIRR